MSVIGLINVFRGRCRFVTEWFVRREIGRGELRQVGLSVQHVPTVHGGYQDQGGGLRSAFRLTVSQRFMIGPGVCPTKSWSVWSRC